MISNSFHSSTKSHSISSAAALAKVERHNSRGYFSFHYDESKISNLIGQADTLAADVENVINQTFAEHVAAYNDKQKRADRKINTTAFEHFAKNKKLDIATEAVFQIGDKEFWGRFRSERIIKRRGKEHVIKSFPPEVKAVMDEIFKKQISAYENIYVTHGAEIARRILADYTAAESTSSKLEQENPTFGEIYQTKSKERVKKMEELSEEEQEKFVAYAEARDLMALVSKTKILERIEKGELHIEVVTGTSHYDEWSPHSHAVGICFADGYSTGLSSRVAKSVVLNRWAMEVIQERLHEIAEQEIEAHPEIFQGETLKEKEQGRNFDYTTEQIKRQNLAKLEENTEKAKVVARAAISQMARARQSAEEAREREMRALVAQDGAERRLADLEERVELIQTYEEYTQKSDEIEEEVSAFERLLDRLKSAVRIFKQKEANEFIDDFKSTMASIFEWFKSHLARVKEFEICTDMEQEKRRSPSLASKIKNAEERCETKIENIEHEYSH